MVSKVVVGVVNRNINNTADCVWMTPKKNNVADDVVPFQQRMGFIARRCCNVSSMVVPYQVDRSTLVVPP